MNKQILRAFGYEPTTAPDWNKSNEYAPKVAKHQSVKQTRPDAVVIIGDGSIYEAVQDSADICANVCGLVVAQFGGGVRVVGFPAYNLDAYLAKLSRNGYEVAVCGYIG